MAKIIIIEDEASIRAALRDILEYEGYEVDEAENGLVGIEMLVTDYYDVALCNLNMPKMHGFDVLFHAHEAGVSTQIIVITAVGTVENAIESSRLGAFDFIVKPPDLSRLLKVTADAVERYKRVVANRLAGKKIYRIGEFVGESPSMQAIRACIEQASQQRAPVLISGPSGAGKGMVAQQIHYKIRNARRPLITVNCAAIPDELLESELFGHEKGAFPGAANRRIGKIEQAEGGTLFLDEIGRISPAVQEKLLHAIDQQTFTRIGSKKELKLNTRIISSTEKDLVSEVEAGNFRADLYDHLREIAIHLPPLSSHREDIPLLIDKFIQDICLDYNVPDKEIEPAALTYLTLLLWEANTRGLRTALERLIIMCEQVITLDEAKLYA